MDIDPYKLKVEIYAVQNPNDPANRIYWAKAHIPEYGLYISDITIRISPRHPDKGLWVQPPAYFIKQKWQKPLEFTKTSRLWKLLRQLAIEAVKSMRTNLSNKPP